MSAHDPASYLPLHPYGFRILLALRREEQHGWAIVKAPEAAPTSWGVSCRRTSVGGSGDAVTGA